MSSAPINVPEVTEDQRKAMVACAKNPRTRHQVELLLVSCKESLGLAQKALDDNADSRAQLEHWRQRWQEAYDKCLYREQVIQAVLDETLGEIRA